MDEIIIKENEIDSIPVVLEFKSGQQITLWFSTSDGVEEIYVSSNDRNKLSATRYCKNSSARAVGLYNIPSFYMRVGE